MVSQVKFATRDVEYLYNRFDYALMITLTSAVNSSDGKLFSFEFNHFITYLKRYLNNDKLYYIVVREVQERGAYHYHMVIFGYKFIPIEALNEFWRLGFVWVDMITTVEGIQYILKYVKKGQQFGRLHASYTFLALFKNEYLKWVGFFRRSFFLGRLIDFVGCQLKKLDFDAIKEWFYKEYEKFPVRISNIITVAGSGILAFS
jgi:hypothetical protein